MEVQRVATDAHYLQAACPCPIYYILRDHSKAHELTNHILHPSPAPGLRSPGAPGKKFQRNCSCVTNWSASYGERQYKFTYHWQNTFSKWFSVKLIIAWQHGASQLPREWNKTMEKNTVNMNNIYNVYNVYNSNKICNLCWIKMRIIVKLMRIIVVINVWKCTWDNEK